MNDAYKRFNQETSRQIEDEGEDNARREKDEKQPVLLWVQRGALHCKYQRSRQPSEDIHHDKVAYLDSGESQKIAQWIFWKTGDEKENEGNIEPFVGDKEIELVYVALLYDLLHKP